MLKTKTMRIVWPQAESGDQTQIERCASRISTDLIKARSITNILVSICPADIVNKEAV